TAADCADRVRCVNVACSVRSVKLRGKRWSQCVRAAAPRGMAETTASPRASKDRDSRYVLHTRLLQQNRPEAQVADADCEGGGQGKREPAKHAPDTEPGAPVTRAGARTASRKTRVSPSYTQGGSRMPELGTYGSGRGARGNSRPYRDRQR